MTWNGGAIAQSLASDRELSQLLLEQKETEITITCSPKEGWVDIRSPCRDDISYLLPTRQRLTAYNTIAGYIRNYPGFVPNRKD